MRARLYLVRHRLVEALKKAKVTNFSSSLNSSSGVTLRALINLLVTAFNCRLRFQSVNFFRENMVFSPMQSLQRNNASRAKLHIIKKSRFNTETELMEAL